MAMGDSRTIKGDLAGNGAHFAIVLSRFNESVGERLLAGAIDALVRHGVDAGAIDIVEVPGAFEIPLALEALAELRRYTGLIALGAVIRGETAHFEFVAGECARGVAEVSRHHGVPLGFGVLTVDTDEQAMARAGGKEGNKGAEAALTALEMANLLKKLSK
jgi:6,7-dimethyl-8-ribityllumazine synthase